ncbi:MAG: antitoxin VbhA family protein [Zoogloeaceae bacterium]|jgi:antitoxin component of RelBE/YafQ-DinJ toxin-antitoxin module|nr:antitoxin VbhA family protein [Zoogloeaceae bacterium]
MKTSTMNLRIEEDLREQFTAVAERNHRPAAQIIRDLMRDYIAQNDAVAASDISEAERAKRQRAVDIARANVGLEGYELSADDETHFQAFVNGQFDWSELATRRLAQVKQKYGLN